MGNIRHKFYSPIFLAVVTTIAASVPVGYNLGIINAPADFITEWCEKSLNERGFQLTTTELNIIWASVVSIFLVGGTVGALSAGWIADKFGRKIPLLVSVGLVVIVSLFYSLCRRSGLIELLLFGRFLSGIAAGMAATIVPMYLTEIAPTRLRGSLGTCMELGVSIGLIIAQVFGLEEVLGTEELWQCALSFVSVFGAIGMLIIPFFPESPKYLYILKKNKVEAVKVLQRLRNFESGSIEEEVALMQKEFIQQTHNRNLCSALRDKRLLMPILLVCSLQAGQQLSGVNSVFFYSLRIFEAAGFQTTDAKWVILSTGLVNLITVGLSSLVMAKINRRPVILTSCFISAVFLVVLTVSIYFQDSVKWLSYISVISVVGYIFGFAVGLGPMPHFMGSELLESGPRPAIMGLGCFCSWFCNFIIAITFPIMQEAMEAFVFLPFVAVCTLLGTFLWYYLPESRGKSATDMAALIKYGFSSKIKSNVNLL